MMLRTSALGTVARRLAAGIALAAASAAVSPASAATWPTFDGNASRAAWLNSDTSIGPQNVKTLTRRWSIVLDAVADSTPIYVEQPQSGSRTGPPMLYQTDRRGTTYGIDAATGTIVWRFKAAGVKITQSTPVLDPSGSAIYVPGTDGYVHKVDVLSGTEVSAPGFPVRITLDPKREKDAGALNLANGYLYVATSGYIGDGPPYQGHIVTVRLSDGTTNVFNSLCSNLQMLLAPMQCSSERSGIWARSAVVVDPDPSMNGRIYVTTGNGLFSPSEFDYGDSVIALSADGTTIEDSFTPSDYVQRAENDLDLGSTAPAMLPPVPNSSTPLLAVQGGKGRMFYLFNRARLGGVGGELQVLHLKGDLMTAPATWQDPSGRAWVFVGEPSGVTAFTVVTESSLSQLQRAWEAHVHGTSPVVMNGLVFVASSGAVRALSVANGSVLWSSTDPGVGGTIGNLHWQSVVVADGALYISDMNGNLTAYALNGSRGPARPPKH
jgi:outer membrane protein assembly factor BamB